jgi:hypothetical protein
MIVDSIPVFYLTKHLTEGEKASIQRGLLTNREGEDYIVQKLLCTVPWEKEEDGTEEDMLNIFWEVHTFKGAVDYPCPVFFCVDRESPRDNSVIAVHEHFFHMSDKLILNSLTDMPYWHIRSINFARVLARMAYLIEEYLRHPVRDLWYGDYDETVLERFSMGRTNYIPVR